MGTTYIQCSNSIFHIVKHENLAAHLETCSKRSSDNLIELIQRSHEHYSEEEEDEVEFVKENGANDSSSEESEYEDNINVFKHPDQVDEDSLKFYNMFYI
jgi:hypothetical protein